MAKYCNNQRRMEKVVIIINAEVSDRGKIISASPVTQKMVEALQRSIEKHSSPSIAIEIISAATLWSKNSRNNYQVDSETIYCPLTIQLPEYFDFPQRKIYSACKDLNSRRRWVEKNLGFKTSVGDSWLGHLWLPIILTSELSPSSWEANTSALEDGRDIHEINLSSTLSSSTIRRPSKDLATFEESSNVGVKRPMGRSSSTNKPIFAEVISEGSMPNSYEHPTIIPHRQLKSLHSLAHQLLDSLSAPPACYLLQFSLYNGEIVFDRLWPFPAAPALITLKTQQPDLFTCHWKCLTNQSIEDRDIIVSNAMPI